MKMNANIHLQLNVRNIFNGIRSKIKIYSLVLFALLMTGCSTIPKAIQVPENTNLVSYQQVSSDYQKQLGKTARWSGAIAKIENLENATLLEIVHFKSYNSTKPIVSDESIGRFRVYVTRFLEPSIYQKGRLVSVLGRIEASEQGKVGEQKILYPVIKNAQLYLWAKEKPMQSILLRDPYWPYSNPFYWDRHRRIHPYIIHKKTTKTAPTTHKK